MLNSVQSGGPSLNDCLYTGPKFNRKILDIFLRFRSYGITLTTDIERAILVISVANEDRDALWFLWIDNINSDTDAKSTLGNVGSLCPERQKILGIHTCRNITSNQFLLLEFGFLSSTLAVYRLFLVWQSLYRSERLSPIRWVLSMFSAVLYGLLVVGSAMVNCWMIFVLLLPALLTTIASIEQFRLSMKSYSFIRENCYKVLYPLNNEDEQTNVSS